MTLVILTYGQSASQNLFILWIKYCNRVIYLSYIY
jgi:hypothetical protein